MIVRMKLLSDCIFGNGVSVPGGEDISVLHDDRGFPYYRGATFKGIFREVFLQHLIWKGMSVKEAETETGILFGFSGDDRSDQEKLTFSDFCIPKAVCEIILNEVGEDPDTVFETFTHLRTFTAIDKNGVVKDGTLRIARCVNRGIVLEAELTCPEHMESYVKEVLPFVKWIGTMRSRGFGKVQIEAGEGR